ncbi:hypothetical protein BVRB_1g014320 [Beta vulgaris subsp. vulgaris]|nr:hypothetical protein BVRB_1g014320 [Beta vulgaris subsp. vulgaris]
MLMLMFLNIDYLSQEVNNGFTFLQYEELPIQKASRLFFRSN